MLTHVIAAAAVRAYCADYSASNEAGARYIVVSQPARRLSGRLRLSPLGSRQSFQAGISALWAPLITRRSTPAFASAKTASSPSTSMSRMAAEITESPAMFGFTNVTGDGLPSERRSPGRALVRSPLVCGPEGSRLFPKPTPPAPMRHYLFADRQATPPARDTPCIASLVTSTLAAPLQVSLAG